MSAPTAPASIDIRHALSALADINARLHHFDTQAGWGADSAISLSVVDAQLLRHLAERGLVDLVSARESAA